jgi:predicted Fe-S protein YdhL (DUF1289 family)
MAIFPRVQSPCPYESDLASVMDGDMCRMCERRVFDLSFMSDEERMAFLAGCTGEICVSYRLPFRPALAAAAMAAALALPSAAAAQEQAPSAGEAAIEAITADEMSVEEAAMQEQWIIVGGIKDLGKLEFVEEPADAAIPELPIVYEDAAAEGAGPAASATASSIGS